MLWQIKTMIMKWGTPYNFLIIPEVRCNNDYQPVRCRWQKIRGRLGSCNCTQKISCSHSITPRSITSVHFIGLPCTCASWTRNLKSRCAEQRGFACRYTILTIDSETIQLKERLANAWQFVVRLVRVHACVPIVYLVNSLASYIVSVTTGVSVYRAVYHSARDWCTYRSWFVAYIVSRSYQHDIFFTIVVTVMSRRGPLRLRKIMGTRNRWLHH